MKCSSAIASGSNVLSEAQICSVAFCIAFTTSGRPAAACNGQKWSGVCFLLGHRTFGVLAAYLSGFLALWAPTDHHTLPDHLHHVIGRDSVRE